MQACVCDVESQFDLSQPTIAHHPKILREAGLIAAGAARPVGLLLHRTRCCLLLDTHHIDALPQSSDNVPRGTIAQPINPEEPDPCSTTHPAWHVSRRP